MPIISEFFGIAVSMYYNDHAPPHFHAEYAEHEVTMSIVRLEILYGNLPAPQLRMVRDWARRHRTELLDNWERARRGESLHDVPALK